MNENFTRFTFTDEVKSLQEHYGSRTAYARAEESGDRYLLTDRERAMIQRLDGFYLATVGKDQWPYVQFRGGPPGFLRILDERTLGFADFHGNRPYISSGNILAGGPVALILMDYPNQTRLKIWAEATLTFIDEDPELAERLVIPGYEARPERLITLRIRAYDWNCPQHIPQRYTLDELARSPDLLAALAERIETARSDQPPPDPA